MNKTLIPVYPSCLSTLAHNDVTLCEVYEKIRNDEVLRQRTLNYRKAVSANLPFLSGQECPFLTSFCHFCHFSHQKTQTFIFMIHKISIK